LKREAPRGPNTKSSREYSGEEEKIANKKTLSEGGKPPGPVYLKDEEK